MASLFGARRDRFTLANLRRLTDVLRVTPASGFSRHTASQVVETFREIAELMIYGDQHDPSFFDAFIEQRVMAHFTKFISPPGGGRPDRDIALQLLQTLAIVVQNIREETSLFFLFSEGHVPKRLVEANLDFDDEEVLGRYVSLLKTTSMRLNASTVQMFFYTGTETRQVGKAAGGVRTPSAAFPLLAAFPVTPRVHGARGVAHHHAQLLGGDGRECASSCAHPNRRGSACPRRRAAGATVAALTERLFAEPDAPGARGPPSLVAELGDLLSFVDDAAGLPEPRRRTASRSRNASDKLWNGLVAPTLRVRGAGAFVSRRAAPPRGRRADSPSTQSDSGAVPRRDAGPPRRPPHSSPCRVWRSRAAAGRRWRASRRTCSGSNRTGRLSRGDGASPTRAARFRCARSPARRRAGRGGGDGRGREPSAGRGGASDLGARRGAARGRVGGGRRDGDRNRRRIRIRVSRGDVRALAAGLVRDDRASPSRAAVLGVVALAPRGEPRWPFRSRRVSLAAAAASAAASMRRAVDGPWGDAAASAFAAEWRTTRRETSRPTLRDETAASWIREAAASTSGSARREANDGDGDANVTHQTRHEADTPSTSAPVVRVREESASAAGKLLRASRELALAAMLLDATRGAPGTRPAFPSEPPARLFGDPADVERAAFPPDSGFAFLEVPPISRSSSAAGDERWAEIREGVEFSGRAATERRFACRVAFEGARSAVSRRCSRCENAKTPDGRASARPRRRRAAAGGAPGRDGAGNRSVVRAVAPLGACGAFADPRARQVAPRARAVPLSCLASASSLASADGSCSASPETELKRLRKKLRDGHWTLAFADEPRAPPRGTRWTPAPPPRARRAAPLAPVLSELS